MQQGKYSLTWQAPLEKLNTDDHFYRLLIKGKSKKLRTLLIWRLSWKLLFWVVVLLA